MKAANSFGLRITTDGNYCVFDGGPNPVQPLDFSDTASVTVRITTSLTLTLQNVNEDQMQTPFDSTVG